MSPLEYFDYAFTQRAAVEIILVSVASAALGPWIVMRSLSFFAHSMGTAAFPGLIAAGLIGVAPQTGAIAGAAVVATGAGVASSGRNTPTRTGLWLSGSLAAGAILASHLGRSGAAVDSALFGSLLTTSTGDLAFAAAAALSAVVVALLGKSRWLAEGMLGDSRGAWGSLLLLAVAIAAIAQLTAAGALLAASLLVLPAVAARPWATTIARWQGATLALALLTGFVGLLASLGFDLPPGGAIATASGLAVALSLTASNVRSSGRARAAGALLAALAIGGCGSAVHGGAGPRIIATTPIVASITSAVTGKTAAVKTLIPIGADPHEYEPKPSDVAALAGSSLIVANGGLDQWVTGLRDRTGSDAPLLKLEGAVRQPIEGPEGAPDPHWFHDPANVAAASTAIAERLSQLDPGNAETYRTNAARLAAEATALADHGRECVSRLPRSQRGLVTDHDAFAYLARSTGLHVTGAIMPSTSGRAAPSARQVDSLIATIREQRIKAIFPERALDPRVSERIAAQTGASADVQLDADTLGPSGSGRDTWAGMWATNVDAIARALSGDRSNAALPGGPGDEHHDRGANGHRIRRHDRGG